MFTGLSYSQVGCGTAFNTSAQCVSAPDTHAEFSWFMIYDDTLPPPTNMVIEVQGLGAPTHCGVVNNLFFNAPIFDGSLQGSFIIDHQDFKSKCFRWRMRPECPSATNSWSAWKEFDFGNC